MKKSGKLLVHVPLLEDGDDKLEIGYNGTMFLLRRGEDVWVEQALQEILLHAGLVEESMVAVR